MLSFVLLIETDSKTIEKVRQWRNQPEVRNQMVNNHIIEEDEHLSWVETLIKDDKSRVWVAYYDDTPFGVVNLTKIDFQKRTTDFGIYIGDQKYRGKGLAKPMLFSLMNYAFEILDLEKMKTRVKKDNKGAYNLYTKGGFQEVLGSGKVINRVDGKAVFIEMEIDRTSFASEKEKLDIVPESLS